MGKTKFETEVLKFSENNFPKRLELESGREVTFVTIASFLR